MSGEAYLKHWALPNMFFHVTTAYALLRHNGVDLGKPDYLAGAQAGAYPENGYYFVAFNTREGRPFADQRLREALARAVDLPKIGRKASDVSAT